MKENKIIGKRMFFFTGYILGCAYNILVIELKTHIH